MISKNTWQRLAGASIKPYKSKFFKGIASIAAISSIVKFFYLQNLKEKAKNGSYIPGFKVFDWLIQRVYAYSY